ncbi:MAG: hypothetical protein K6T83_21790 [Alicyclobacillus sp.]|nr:hypothetical protein [Alicyclobacillus sp.]
MKMNTRAWQGAGGGQLLFDTAHMFRDRSTDSAIESGLAVGAKLIESFAESRAPFEAGFFVHETGLHKQLQIRS